MNFPEGTLDWLVRTAWQSVALVLIVLALQRILGARLTPRWRMALWWIVVARLVLPPVSLPGVGVTGEMPWEIAAAPPAVVATAPEPIPEPPLTAPAAPFAEPSPVAAPAAPVPEVVSPPAPEPAPAGPSLATVLALIWLGGAGVFGVLSVLSEMRMLRRLTRGPALDDPALRRIVDDCARAAGIRRTIRVHRSPGVEVPTLIGVLRPRLLLPASALRWLNEDELRHVVLHEVEHVRHHDLAVNWLLHAVLCLHWMNPFAWLAVGRLRAERETVRDFGVLRRSPGTTGREYGKTILRILECSTRARKGSARVALLDTGLHVKRRIAMLAAHGHRRRGGLVLGCLTALVLVAATAVIASESPVAAAGDDGPGPFKGRKGERQRVLLIRFDSSGDLLEREKNLNRSLETVAEAILAETRQTVSGADLAAACRKTGCRVIDLNRSADLRLKAARTLGADHCLTGWACSFGKRIVLILEVIDVAKGLPGRVHRVSCESLEGIPDAMKKLMDFESAPAVAETEPPPTAARPEVFDRMPEDDLLETYPNDEWRELVGLRDAGPDAFDEKAIARAEHLLAKSLEHARRLHEDRDYRDEWVIRTNVRLHPTFKDRRFEVLSRPPYLLFEERPKDGGAGDLLAAARYGDVLARVHAEFQRLVGKPLRLPPLSSRPQASERILRVFVSAERQTLDQKPLPAGVEGYYSPREQWLVMLADAKRTDKDEGLRYLIRLATHQLVHTYTKIGVEEAGGEEVAWSDKALRARTLWLETGFAEFMAGAMLPGGKGFDPTRVYEARRSEWRLSRQRKKDDWSLPDLLSIKDRSALRRRSMQIGLAPAEVARLVSVYYAEAWSFTRFLWNAEKGKYRPWLLAILAVHFKGEPARDPTGRTAADPLRDLRRRMDDDVDWAVLEAQWREFETDNR